MLRTTVKAGLGAAALSLLVGTAAAQDLTLRYAVHPGSHVAPLLDYFIPKYEELTGVRVSGEVMPPDQLRDRMAIEATGGTNLFDMAYHSPGWFGSFHEHVIDMRPLMEQHGFDLDAYYDLVMEATMTSPTRPGGETVAGEVLEQPLYGWSDSMRHPSGIARAYIVMLYSAGIEGWDENYEDQ